MPCSAGSAPGQAVRPGPVRALSGRSAGPPERPARCRGRATVDIRYQRRPSPGPSSPSVTPSGVGRVSHPVARDGPGQPDHQVDDDRGARSDQPGRARRRERRRAGPAERRRRGGRSLSGQFTLTLQHHFEAQGISVGTKDTTVVENGSVSGTLCALALRFLNETITACTATGVEADLGCGPVNTKIDLTGLMPPEPMGTPTVSARRSAGRSPTRAASTPASAGSAAKSSRR